MSKVTDLEKWAMDNCWQPYYPMLPDALKYGASAKLVRKDICRRAGSDFLQGTVDMLNANPELADHVVGRLGLIGDHFPHYIQHPLVDWMHLNGVMMK